MNKILPRGLLFVFAFLLSCSGPTGPTGLTGLQGEKGDPGTPGVPGSANILTFSRIIKTSDYYYDATISGDRLLLTVSAKNPINVDIKFATDGNNMMWGDLDHYISFLEINSKITEANATIIRHTSPIFLFTETSTAAVVQIYDPAKNLVGATCKIICYLK